MKSRLALLLILLSTTVQAVKLRVLFVGNSYTYQNNLPNMVAQFATSQGDTVVWQMVATGGATFYEYADPGNSKGASLVAALKGKVWDIVVLQEQSQIGAVDSTFMQTSPGIKPGSKKHSGDLCRLVQHHQPRARVFWYMTWGRINGDPNFAANYPECPWMRTYDGMQGMLRHNYLRFGNRVLRDSMAGGILANARLRPINYTSVAPVGVAWARVRRQYPALNLYNADGSHPSTEGSYLAACVMYTAFFVRQPTSLAYTGGLSQTAAQQLLSVAAPVVLDSVARWRIRPDNKVGPATKPGNKALVADRQLASLIRKANPAIIDADDYLDTTHPQLASIRTLASSRRDAVAYANLVGDNDLILPHIVTRLDGLRYLRSLSTASFPNNEIDSVTARLPSSLRSLDIAGNSCIKIGNVLPLGLRRLNTPQVASLKSTPNVWPDSLRYLNVRGAFVQGGTITLRPLPSRLDSLVCGDNQLATLPTLPSRLRYLSAQFANLNTWPNLPTSMVWLDLTGNQLMRASGLPTTLRQLDLKQNLLDSIVGPWPDSLKVLNISGNLLRRIPLLPQGLRELSWGLNNARLCLPNNPPSMAVVTPTAVFCTTTSIGSPVSPESNILAYPNPTTGLLSIKTDDGIEITQVSIRDISGKLVPDVLALPNGQLDLRALPAGVYHLQLTCKQTGGTNQMRQIKVAKY